MKWILLLLAGCASAPVVRVRVPSNFEQCANHCAELDAGDPLLWENRSETFCMCRKPPVGT